MKALQFFGPHDLRFVDLPEPEIQPDQVLMKIRQVGICGTDIHIYNGGMSVPTPLTLGHEFVGDIVKIGSQVTNIQVGDRAAAEHVIGCGTCTFCKHAQKNLCKNPTVIGLHKPGALAEFLALPADLVFPVPAELTYEDGVLIEPLSIAVYAVRKAGVKVGDTVTVIGQGPIGLFVDQVSRAAGATVIGIDKHNNRLEYALQNQFIDVGINLSSEDYLQKFKQQVDSDGSDVVFEVVGNESSATLAIELARPAGKVVVLGVFAHDVQLNMMNIVRKELNVQGSWTCLFSFEPTISLLKNQRISTAGLITHRYPFENAIQAFEDSIHDKANRIKSIIEFT